MRRACATQVMDKSWTLSVNCRTPSGPCEVLGYQLFLGKDKKIIWSSDVGKPYMQMCALQMVGATISYLANCIPQDSKHHGADQVESCPMPNLSLLQQLSWN